MYFDNNKYAQIVGQRFDVRIAAYQLDEAVVRVDLEEVLEVVQIDLVVAVECRPLFAQDYVIQH